MTKVSIIVPVYNVENYLSRCLDSLVNQTLTDIEIIVVNDGSLDNSQSVIEQYANKYPNLIRAFIKENGGLSDARNFGVLKATGEFLGFVDSDDWVDHHMFEEMYNKAMLNNSDIIVCDTISYYSEEKNYIIKSNKMMAEDILKNYFISPPMACTKIYRKYLFNSVKFKTNSLYEDLELIPTFVIQTNKIDFIDRAYYYYFQREGSIMKQMKFNNRLLDIFSVLESIESKMSANNQYINYEKEIEYLFIEHLLRSAALRFSSLENSDENIEKISNIFKTKFPNWRLNPYYLKRGVVFKIICFFTIHKQKIALRLIEKTIKIFR